MLAGILRQSPRTRSASLLADFYDLIGFAVCHQLPERSLYVAGGHLPVCARDTGIYVGFLVAMVLISVLERDKPQEMPPWHVLLICGLFVVAMGVDGVTSYAGLRTTTNGIRLATGLMAGFAIPPIVLGMLNYQLWKTGSAARVLGKRSHVVAWLVALPVAYVAMSYPLPYFDRFYSTITALGILTSFVTVNLVLVTLIPPFEKRATRFRDVLPLAAIAFLLTVAQLTLAGWLHSVALSLGGQ